MGYSFQLAARVLLHEPLHRHDSSRRALAWNKKQFSGFTIRDRSDDPLHHEHMLYMELHLTSKIFNDTHV